MAISSPTARRSSRRRSLQSLRLRSPRGCVLVLHRARGRRSCSASPGRPSRWWTATSIMAWKPAATDRPPGRLRSYPQRRSAARLGRSSTTHRRCGSPPRLWTRGPSADVGPQGVRGRRTASDRRSSTSRWACTAVPRRHPRIRTPRRSAIGWRSRVRRSTRAAREVRDHLVRLMTGAVVDQRPLRGYGLLGAARRR